MTITINNKDYNFDLQGTVGLVYMCQRILDHEPDFNMPYDQIALMYCAFQCSNRKEKVLPDLMDFMSAMTSAKYKEILEFFWQRWNELEGIKPNAEKKAEETKKGEDSAPADSIN